MAVVRWSRSALRATAGQASRALRCATALRDQLAGLGLGVRVGAHLGEIEGRGADIAGVAVHLTARVMTLAAPGQILTTAAMPLATLGGGFDFQSQGNHRLKGFEQEFEVFELSDTGTRSSPTTPEPD